MTHADILKKVDHTLLKPDATWDEIRAVCDAGRKYHTASVCIPAVYVDRAVDYLQGNLPICTVIGFPTGYSTTAAKVFEAQDAVRRGASEIDMVLQIGWLKDGLDTKVRQEIEAVKAAVGGRILKVIIEACLLSDAEKIRCCKIVSASGADFIKTSTGFSAGGATVADISLMKAHCRSIGIKAAGGIRSFVDARALLEAGATRLGTSQLVKLAEAEENGCE